MEIIFRTKEEANQEQRDTFLALTPVQRFYEFLALSERMSKFPTKKKKENTNFVIDVYGKNLEK